MAFSKAVWEVRIQHKTGIIFFPLWKGSHQNEWKTPKNFTSSLHSCLLSFPQEERPLEESSRVSVVLFFVLLYQVWLELCTALSGWQGWLRLLRWLRACGRFDRVQGFAKPRVFGSLDFIHKGSSLVLQLLRKQNSQNWSKTNQLTKKHPQTQSLQSSTFLATSQALGFQIEIAETAEDI